jgi:hypothetical protein
LIRTLTRASLHPLSCTPSSWPEKLSNNSKIFLPSPLILLCNHRKYSSMISPVIQFVFVCQYKTRKSIGLIFLKHRGCVDVAIHQTNSFFPEADIVKTSATRFLLFFPPLSAFVASVRSGISFQKRPVSSILRTLSGSYSVARRRTFSICVIASGLSICAESAYHR